jgi:hypothetical protein
MQALMNHVFDPTKLKHITFSPSAGCNTPDDVIMFQVSLNIRRGLPQAKPHTPNTETVALVCGGPSLIKTEKKLVDLAWRGAKVVCVNGTYQWCIDRNIKPSAMVMLDARKFNSRFLETPVPGCRYLLGSQCHGDAFELCRDRDVTIWHACSAGEPELELLNAFYFNRCYPITLGTTVAIRAISLLRMFGFQSFEIFGLDSCWFEDAHHAYDQPENSKDKKIPVWLRPEGRDDLAERFICSPWQMKQSADFQQLIRERGDKFRLNVHGDGLIAAIMRIASELGSLVTPEEEK